MFRALVPVATRFPRAFPRFEEDMNRMMERFFGDEAPYAGWEGFLPRTNVAETNTALEVTVELPGMKAEDFTVEAHNGDLWITGEKKEEREEKGKTFHRVERHHGKFRRIVPLPAGVNAEKVDATYRDGVLKVVLEKAEKAKAKAIPVKG
jgi:HSP20 family protein